LENFDVSWMRGRLRRGAGHARYNVAALAYTVRNCFLARARDGRALVMVGDRNGQVLATAGVSAAGPGAAWVDALAAEDPVFNEDLGGWTTPVVRTTPARLYTIPLVFDVEQTGPGSKSSIITLADPIEYAANERIGLLLSGGLTLRQTYSSAYSVTAGIVEILPLGGGMVELSLDGINPLWSTLTHVQIATGDDNAGYFPISSYFFGKLYYTNFTAIPQVYGLPYPTASGSNGSNGEGYCVLSAQCNGVWKTLYNTYIISEGGGSDGMRPLCDLVVAGATAGYVTDVQVACDVSGDAGYAIRAINTSAKLLVVPADVEIRV
jgi:hypothetical protein